MRIESRFFAQPGLLLLSTVLLSAFLRASWRSQLEESAARRCRRPSIRHQIPFNFANWSIKFGRAKNTALDSDFTWVGSNATRAFTSRFQRGVDNGPNGRKGGGAEAARASKGIAVYVDAVGFARSSADDIYANRLRVVVGTRGENAVRNVAQSLSFSFSVCRVMLCKSWLVSESSLPPLRGNRVGGINFREKLCDCSTRFPSRDSTRVGEEIMATNYVAVFTSPTVKQCFSFGLM